MKLVSDHDYKNIDPQLLEMYIWDVWYRAEVSCLSNKILGAYK